ncbi:MAG: glycosyltransferase family 4 protein [Desulfobacterales bacterium]|nr:MAG: glycosyltransferase family 4 protein [Desulfobacterales bacterium]
MRIAICTPDLAPGDAVSNDVIGMYQAFREKDFEARIFAANAYVQTPAIFPPERIQRFIRNRRDILVYHHSVGWDLGLELHRKLKCRKVVKYHNVTPAEFFKGIAENYCAACTAGRQQLSALCRVKTDLYLADSDYNLREIIDSGTNGAHCGIVPPFHHIDRLRGITADAEIIHRFNDKYVNFLMVGRVVPNKNYEDLIQTFYIYHRQYNPRSRLLIVGKEDAGLASYSMSLRAKIRHLNLEGDVLFTGSVPDAALKAYYQVADVFVITSKHEGFCVPLVEAMSMRIPIVAYGTSAIPGTVDKVGLVWNEQDPALLAASVNQIVENDHVRRSLGEMGWRRYQQQFTNARIKERLFREFRMANLLT